MTSFECGHRYILFTKTTPRNKNFSLRFLIPIDLGVGQELKISPANLSPTGFRLKLISHPVTFHGKQAQQHSTNSRFKIPKLTPKVYKPYMSSTEAKEN